MNTRCITAARVAAFIIMVAALFLAPNASQAQSIRCDLCDHFTISVRQDLGCAVTVCYVTSPFTLPVCKTLQPSDEIEIKCSVYQAWVNTCSGPYYLIPANHISLCSKELKFAVGCCGEICSAPSPTICSRLEIRPLPCSSLSCP